MAQGRVLLVDDEASILTSYSRALVEGGFDVTKAGGSVEALRRLKAMTFDVILTDLLIPETNGLALLERLHTMSPDLPVIVMLDKMSNKIAVEVAERGVLQVLVKPISGELLRRTVTRAVRSRRSRQSVIPSFLGHGTDPQMPVTMKATKAKNQMGQMLETVMQGGVVLITKHETPKAAVISIEEYERLSRMEEAKLDALSNEFDALLDGMQTPEARAGMQAAFDASPEQLAQAALEFARKRA
jgi:prevent-host-death family protein